jgi:hypothetical protein
VRHRPAASFEAVEQARVVLERLERIEALRRDEAPAGVLLDEARALLSEAEAWAQADRADDRASAALELCREALAAGEQAAESALTRA